MATTKTFTLGASEATDVISLNTAASLAGVVQVSNWSAGALTVQGSLDGTNWDTLKDPFGTALSLSADGIYEIATGVPLLRVLGNGSLGAGTVVSLHFKGA